MIFSFGFTDSDSRSHRNTTMYNSGKFTYFVKACLTIRVNRKVCVCYERLLGKILAFFFRMRAMYNRAVALEINQKRLLNPKVKLPADAMILPPTATPLKH